MRQTDTVAAIIASMVQAKINCGEATNGWESRWNHRLEWIGRNVLPSGSGFDSGSSVCLGKSDSQMLFIETAYHHMDEAGYYDGWTEHTVRVRPTFFGVALTVTGRDRNGIKDYIGETFQYVLDNPMDADTYARFIAFCESDS
jgi:hypothetical protein